MRLQEIMSTQVVTIGPDEPASTAWSRMGRKRIRHLLVTEGGRLIGVLSERDLGGRNGGAVRRGRTVRELMTQQAASATPATTLREAANLMRGRLIGSLPVVKDGRIVGIVTATDVLGELGRGSSRPTVRAKRRSMRLPPVGARRAAAKRTRAAKRGVRAAKRAKRGGKAAEDTLGRAPMTARVARAAKRTAGRTLAAETPAYIRSVGAVLDAADESYLRRKLGRKLGKFASSIGRTSVRVEDVNSPRGGVDKRCSIKVVLSGLPSVYVEERHHSVQAVMDRALARTERAVRQTVQRRRMRPLKSRKKEERVLALG
jgi:CBS domain-containing protein/ribosome-associated translation inhibitor RaiA